MEISKMGNIKAPGPLYEMAQNQFLKAA
ncbi:MAG: hypothetical protein PWP54_1594, partial [Thermosipho sp. (in: thermotogales)]|nr:hypothetical protein [Thermosipho sp. (in: thermotogales)]